MMLVAMKVKGLNNAIKGEELGRKINVIYVSFGIRI